MKFGLFYEIQVPRPAPPEAEHQRIREIVDQVRLAECAIRILLAIDHVEITCTHCFDTDSQPISLHQSRICRYALRHPFLDRVIVVHN